MLSFLEQEIRSFLESVGTGNQNRSPLEIAGLISQFRVILDDRSWRDAYPTIGFYADWLVHNRLRGNQKCWLRVLEATRVLVKNFEAHAGGTASRDVTAVFQ